MELTREATGTMVACRQQALLVSDLEDALEEARRGADGIVGQKDGGGHGGASSSHQERYVLRAQKLLEKSRRAKDRLQALSRQARSIILTMDEGMGRFAMLYYVEALSEEEIRAAMQVSDKTIYRWRSEIEKNIRDAGG